MQHQNAAHDPNHPRHDATLIAGHAAGDLADSERIRAQALVAECTDCAELHRDLVSIAVATRALPNLATAPRDFRIQPAQAERLRRGSWLRTILAPFGAARSATRPLAAAFTSLGIAGLLIGTVLPGLLGGTASSPGQRQNLDSTAASQAPAAAPEVVQGAAGATRDPDIKDGALGPQYASAPPTDNAYVITGGGDASEDSGERLTSTSPANLLMVGSLGLLAVGLALFGLRLAGRRLR